MKTYIKKLCSTILVILTIQFLISCNNGIEPQTGLTYLEAQLSEKNVDYLNDKIYQYAISSKKDWIKTANNDNLDLWIKDLIENKSLYKTAYVSEQFAPIMQQAYSIIHSKSYENELLKNKIIQELTDVEKETDLLKKYIKRFKVIHTHKEFFGTEIIKKFEAVIRENELKVLDSAQF